MSVSRDFVLPKNFPLLPPPPSLLPPLPSLLPPPPSTFTQNTPPLSATPQQLPNHTSATIRVFPSTAEPAAADSAASSDDDSERLLDPAWASFENDGEDLTHKTPFIKDEEDGGFETQCFDDGWPPAHDANCQAHSQEDGRLLQQLQLPESVAKLLSFAAASRAPLPEINSLEKRLQQVLIVTNISLLAPHYVPFRYASSALT
jgi:hypothetical protein